MESMRLIEAIKLHRYQRSDQLGVLKGCWRTVANRRQCCEAEFRAFDVGDSFALTLSKQASQSGGGTERISGLRGRGKGEAELDVYSTWIIAIDRAEEGDGRLPAGGAGRSPLVRWPRRGVTKVRQCVWCNLVTDTESLTSWWAHSSYVVIFKAIYFYYY